MNVFNVEELKKLYIPSVESHKGQNGKLMIIGGSHLFHGASLWALKVASRIVDMVFYASIPENNKLTEQLKGELYDFIAIPRSEIESYIDEADAVLLGPGMIRAEGVISNVQYQISSIKEVDEIEHEGLQAYHLTKFLLSKYPNKKWVIDAGALQMMEPEWLKQLNGNVIITPHHKEFDMIKLKIQNAKFKIVMQNLKLEEQVKLFSQEYNCLVLLKGVEDVVCSPEECIKVEGGNVGMTKGGTGDVLAGLVGALACKNDLFLAAKAASFINKYTGDELYKKVRIYFNASDLADEIPKVMKNLLF